MSTDLDLEGKDQVAHDADRALHHAALRFLLRGDDALHEVQDGVHVALERVEFVLGFEAVDDARVGLQNALL